MVLPSVGSFSSSIEQAGAVCKGKAGFFPAAQPPGAGGGNIRTNKRYKSATKVSIIRRKCFESQFKSRQIRQQFLVQSADFFRNSLKNRSGGRSPS